MDNLKIILRLYDFFIATDPMMPIYLAAIVIYFKIFFIIKKVFLFLIFKIVCERADEILEIDCDMASLHTVISKYPSQIHDIEVIEDYIVDALNLYKEYPPEKLPELNREWLEKWYL